MLLPHPISQHSTQYTVPQWALNNKWLPRSMAIFISLERKGEQGDDIFSWCELIQLDRGRRQIVVVVGQAGSSNSHIVQIPPSNSHRITKKNLPSNSLKIHTPPLQVLIKYKFLVMLWMRWGLHFRQVGEKGWREACSDDAIFKPFGKNGYFSLWYSWTTQMSCFHALLSGCYQRHGLEVREEVTCSSSHMLLLLLIFLKSFVT